MGGFGGQGVGVHIIREQGILKRGSRAFFVRCLVMIDTISFLDQREILWRVEGFPRGVRSDRFFLEKGMWLDFGVRFVFSRVFFGG
jgi:hypothetical protein